MKKKNQSKIQHILTFMIQSFLSQTDLYALQYCTLINCDLQVYYLYHGLNARHNTVQCVLQN